MKQKIKNRGDWYMVGMVVRYACSKKVRGCRPKDGTTWVNMVLIQGATPQVAYKKAMDLGRADARSTNASHLWFGRWQFLGLAELIPISDDIADGTELLSSDYGRHAEVRAKRLVQPKTTLIKQASQEKHSKTPLNGTARKLAPVNANMPGKR